MKRRVWRAGVLLAVLWATPAMADNRFVVRTAQGTSALAQFCLLQSCTVVGAIDGSLNQVFLLTTPSMIDATTFLSLLRSTPGILNAELDQLVSLVGGLNAVTLPPAGLTDNAPVNYFGTRVWNGYANQPASTIVHVQDAQNTFHVAGTGIVADIDTGVDPSHPALNSVLLPGYDFTRNQLGGSEMTDFTSPAPPPCPSCQPAIVNQSTAAVLDQSTAAVLDGNVQYAAFGHGTMVMGVIHLVAPKAQLLPLKAFRSNGTGYLSDILRAIYYAVQNNVTVINMSFDLTTNSQELTNALNYANQLNVICAASAGNDGQGPPLLVYPAAIQSDVMGVASTSDTDVRSSFSNFGNAIVWVAAPGEAVVTTYPFSTYSAGWGTSFSAPFVSGGAALLRSLRNDINESLAASAVAHAQFVGADTGNGRLDLLMALAALPAGSGSPDFSVSAAPTNVTTATGVGASFTVSATPFGGFNQMVTWGCAGAPAAGTCTVSPSSVTLDGSNAATATVMLSTTARAFLMPAVKPLLAPRLFPWEVSLGFVACLLILLMSYGLRRTPRRSRCLSAYAVLVHAVLCTSCGGATSSGPPRTQGTPAGNYTITVTGSSGNLAHSTSIQLTVK